MAARTSIPQGGQPLHYCVRAHENIALISDDKQIRPAVIVNRSTVKKQTCNSFETRVEWYSNWTQLVRSKAILKHVLLTKDYCDYVFRGCHYWPQSLNSGTLKSAEIHILKEIQRSEISEVSECLIRKKPILNGSSIIFWHHFRTWMAYYTLLGGFLLYRS